MASARSWMIVIALTMMASVTAICSAIRIAPVLLRNMARQIGPICML